MAKKFSPQGIPPPEKLKITDEATSLAQNWRRFFRGWNNYEIATNLRAESGEFRCAIFMTMCGSDAIELFDSFKFAEGESEEDIAVVLKKFEDYCVETTHEAYESFRFHSRDQEQSESIDAFVAELRKLAKGCNFLEEDRMIRDRILVGVKSKKTQGKLLEDSKLTLKAAIDTCRALEASQSKLETMTGKQTLSVDRVKHNKSEKKSDKQKKHSGSETSEKKNKEKKCTRCGYKWHKDFNDCPAKYEKCDSCRKVGHFISVCRNKDKKVRQVRDSDSDEEHVFLGSIHEINSMNSDDWHTELLVDGKNVRFRIDTGADVTVVPDSYFKTTEKLQKTDKKLYLSLIHI